MLTRFLAVAVSAGVLLGAGPFTDYTSETPGARHHITTADLPAPGATESANNGPSLVKRPDGAWPRAPKGWKVSLYAEGLKNPRQIRTAPNGDVFIAESSAGRIRVLRGVGPDGKAKTSSIFASGLDKPFGIAFYPPGPKPSYVYFGNTGEVVRFAYAKGDLKASGKPERVASVPGGGFVDGGHWTRDVAFSLDGKKMFVSVGSYSNVNDPDANPVEHERADILEFAPDGSGKLVYASGLRNPVGLAVDPLTGELWTSVNERDRLGDNLPPDYITHVKDGGFYGWPWFYIGGHQDPRHAGKHPELKDKVIVPDVLVQPHNASLGIAFGPDGALYAAEHGSWNRAVRTGYEVIRVPMKAGRAGGGYEDFLTGFVTTDGEVWGRPVGVAFGEDGALLVTDDASGSVWRVSR
ncbi:MAG TPA: PQQ-dependent sugar dehydrogenase [Elusimicrobiota bacterium]|nr:PQQ-dependent sugar dehydrogenase [Elusimicrobiota bacterium]